MRQAPNDTVTQIRRHRRSLYPGQDPRQDPPALGMRSHSILHRMPPNYTDDSKNKQKTKKNKPPMFHNISPNSFFIYIHYRMSRPFSNYFTPSNKYAPLGTVVGTVVGAVPVRAARREQSAILQKVQRILVQSLCKLTSSTSEAV